VYINLLDLEKEAEEVVETLCKVDSEEEGGENRTIKLQTFLGA